MIDQHSNTTHLGKHFTLFYEIEEKDTLTFGHNDFYISDEGNSKLITFSYYQTDKRSIIIKSLLIKQKNNGLSIYIYYYVTD